MRRGPEERSSQLDALADGPADGYGAVLEVKVRFRGTQAVGPHSARTRTVGFGPR